MEMPPGLIERFGPLEELGRGACGVVYRLGVDRALKVMALTGDGAREARELEIARRLEHPHLIPCFESGIAGGAAWVVMPLASESMHEVMARPGERDRAWRLLQQAARGVAALHGVGVIHRDLKPANILVIDDQARVADFGMARGMDTATLTATGTILGTPQYMSPEQARGQRATPALDAYALGVIAYEIAEGVAPYPDGLSTGELLARIASGQRDPLQRCVSWLPTTARRAIDQALEADPAARPADLAAWADQLGELPTPRSDPARVAITQDLGATQEAPSLTKDRPTLAPAPHLAPARVQPPTPAPPARRGGLIAGLLLLGVSIGVLSQGAPRNESAPTEDGVSDPRRWPKAADPGPLADHPHVGAATQAVDELYRELAEPFRQEGHPGLYHFVEKLGAAIAEDEERSKTRFQPFLDSDTYQEQMLDYLERLEDWVKALRKHLTLAEQESERVFSAVYDRVCRLPYIHHNMLRRRLQHGGDAIFGAAQQVKAKEKGDWLHWNLRSFHANFPGMIGPGTWPTWALLSRSYFTSFLEDVSVPDEDVAGILRRFRDPMSPTIAAHMVDASTRLRRPSRGRRKLDCPTRWRLWRAAVAAVPALPEDPSRANDAMVMAADFAFLRWECPGTGPVEELRREFEGLLPHIDSELSWLEGFDPAALRPEALSAGPKARLTRVVRALRNLSGLPPNWTRSPELSGDRAMCEIRGRLRDLHLRHPELLSAAFQRWDELERPASFANLTGCR